MIAPLYEGYPNTVVLVGEVRSVKVGGESLAGRKRCGGKKRAVSAIIRLILHFKNMLYKFADRAVFCFATYKVDNFF